jgi:2,3-bisphosphoglycerate-independent phosphoglycerate mutase
LADLVSEAGLEPVVHAFTDGRDTAPKRGVDFLDDLERHVEGVGGRVATVCGRYYAMDRDENWGRTHRAYRAVVDREADHVAPSAVGAIEAAYDRGETDEFVEPTLVEGGPELADGDGAICCNFRADRARQLTRMLADIEPDWTHPTDPPAVELVTMTEYDRTFDLPVVVSPNAPEDTLGEVLAAAGRTQLRLAETEKHAHVTYFLNGGREVAFPGETREIVESPDVPTYDQQPAMSAPTVTDRALAVIDRADPDTAVVNYANADMVGHTGDFEAAVTAVEAVDTQLARLVDAMQAAGAHVVLTADHGNADEMGTAEAPHTAHTTNPVPVVFLAPDGTDGGHRIRPGGTLADVAPTVLELAGLSKPSTMTGESLLE